MRISMRHTGTKNVIGRLRRLKSGINMVTNDALRESAEYVRNESISYLYSVAGHRKGMSGPDSILDPENWSIEFDRPNSVKLQCTSPHAGIVEFGKSDTILHPGKGWPVGRQQSGPETYVKAVPLQAGYRYLSNTINNPTVKENVNQIISRHIKKLVL